jgi:hypothetical protein
MMKYSLTLAALLCLISIGCKHTLGHYPGIDDGSNINTGTPGELVAPTGPAARNAVTPPKVEENAPAAEQPQAKPSGNTPQRTIPEATTPALAPGVRLATRPSISKLYGVAVRATHIVYVIDRSATTNKYWEDLRTQIIASLGDLYIQQDFSVILMGERRPRMGPGSGLITATKHNQMLAAKMLLETAADGKTDPLPALRLAIATLASVDDKGGKVLYFVTDRAMMGEAAVTLFQTTEAAKGIVVMPYMIGDGGSDTQKVMEKLASQTGGRFTQVAEPAGE